MITSKVVATIEDPYQYNGLLPFCPEDARFFLGRGSDADLIAANVLSASVLILHGPKRGRQEFRTGGGAAVLARSHLARPARHFRAPLG